LGLAILLLSSVSFAQSAPETPPVAAPEEQAEDPTLARAREAFVLGTGLAREGQWLDALAAFERSAQLKPHPITTYNLAYCERALGRYTRARQLFKRALSEHAAQKGGTLTDDLFAQAQSYLVESERRVARASVTIAPAGTALTVDGRGIEPDESKGGPPVYVAGTEGADQAPPPGAFELVLDPGKHIFVLVRPGSPDKVVIEVFKPGERRRLALSAESASAPPPPRTAASPPGRDYTWPIVAYGVGAAGLTIGSIFGIATFSKEDDLHQDCGDDKVCGVEQQADIDTADRYALISNIGFGVGIAGIGVGTFLLLSSSGVEAPKPAEPAKSALRVWVLPTSAGVRGTF